MNNPWLKILVFGLLFGIGGFLIGRSCGHGCGHKGGGCHKEMSCCKDGACEHGGSCCTEGGKCDKAGCDHTAMMGGHGKACCMGGHSEGGSCKGGMGPGMCSARGEGEDKVHTVIDGLKASNFQVDTTINIEGGTVNVKRTGDKMEVKVEMRDSLKVEEKTVEVH